VHDVVADKGYHSGAVLAAMNESMVCPVFAEPERGRRN
jgi:hypothetical protein